MLKMKYTDVKPLREQLLLEQDNKCRLCNQLIHDDAVLDHCHSTGLVRGVLHRGCNMFLGKIENNLKRNKITLPMLMNLFNNYFDYTISYTEHTHPTYKVPGTKKKVKSKNSRKKQ